jgi:hypothetical protein
VVPVEENAGDCRENIRKHEEEKGGVLEDYHLTAKLQNSTDQQFNIRCR